MGMTTEAIPQPEKVSDILVDLLLMQYLS